MRRLTNKSYRTYDKLSRYATFPYYYDMDNNKYVYGTTAQLKDNTIHSIYVVKARDTLDTIALYFYNNPTYFWVICLFNHIRDPYKKLEVGTELKIPTLSTIEFDR